MKKLVVLLLAVLALASCGKKESIKVTDPDEIQALRTRDASCPVDSVLSPEGAKIIFNVVGRVKPKAFVSDFFNAKKVSEKDKSMEKIKEAYSVVKETKAQEYSPGLTIYASVMIVLFVIFMLLRLFRAIFKNN